MTITCAGFVISDIAFNLCLPIRLPIPMIHKDVEMQVLQEQKSALGCCL
ncbi:MAG: hypothetical protein WCY88_15160 [Spongiibacteraceae bacterium]|jgi:hypothetical protein